MHALRRSTRARARASCKWGTVSFLLSKRRRGVRFLFLKKRNKRHCEAGCSRWKSRFPARPAWNEKRAVHMRTARFVLYADVNGNSNGKRLRRKWFSFASFLLKRKEGVRFLFLKKRNKRRCGTGCSHWKSRFPARPAWNEKRAVHNENRPFCAVCRRKWQ